MPGSSSTRLSDASRRMALPERALVTSVLLFITWLLIFTNWTWRLDHALYDTHQLSWSRPAPADVLIIAIDEQSLAQYGRWPWPRRLHAELLRHLQAARAVVMDLIFAEPDPRDAEGDQLLAQAIHDHGRVILPVLVEEQRRDGQLIETLPLPSFIDAAAGLGHAHVELDQDGIVRTVYLREGLGEARWANLGLETLRLLQPGRWDAPPGLRNPEPQPASPYVRVRDNHVLLQYAGPPGHFARISYTDVVQGRYAPGIFDDKIVFVGATATGLGDAMPTPVSGLSQPMPGVEINANIFDTLRQQLTITPLGIEWRLLLGSLLALLPALLFPRLTPRQTLLMAAALLLGVLALSAGLLRGLHLWLPPSMSFIALSLAYPLWSWRRMEYTMRFLNQQLERLHQEPALTQVNPPSIPAAMGFVRNFVPVEGWAVIDEQGVAVAQWGKVPDPCKVNTSGGDWAQQSDAQYWTRVSRDEVAWRFGVRMARTTPPSEREGALLLELVRPYTPPAASAATGGVELLHARVTQVQQVSHRLQGMRRFITESLAHMADGVLVCNNLGQVTLANPKAAEYCGAPNSETLIGAALSDLLQGLQPEGGGGWQPVLQQSLLENRGAQVRARASAQGRDVLVHTAPLALESGRVRGLIVNLSDITQLRDSERRRDEALNFLSHDLRAPLVSLLALLEKEGNQPISAQQAAFLLRAEHYTRRTLELADSFLFLSRAESGEPLPMDEINLGDIAYNAYNVVWAQAQNKQIELVNNIHADNCWLHGDAQLLQRAITNLLANAIAYSSAGARVELDVSISGAWAQCRVSDTGPGIAAADLPHLFDRFRRGHAAQRDGGQGAGLGLALVKAVAERHGGTVLAHSEAGAGAEFTLRLPLSETPG